MHALLEVSLVGVRPRVARSLLIPASINLKQLHFIFQAALGWKNYHPYEFRSEDLSWGCEDLFLGSDNEQIDESVTLDEVLSLWRASGAIYTYDFSSRWTHHLKILSTLESLPENKVAFLLDGTGICPPEGSGGPGNMANTFHIAEEVQDHPMKEEFLNYTTFRRDEDYQSAVISSQAKKVAETSLRLLKEEEMEENLSFSLIE